MATDIRRELFTTFDKDDNEPPVNAKYEKIREKEEEDLDELEKYEVKLLNEKEFCSRTKEQLLAAKTFTYSFSNKKKKDVVWKIHQPDDNVANCELYNNIQRKYHKGPTVNGELRLDFQNKTDSQFFLDNVWPSMKGFGKKMDEYYTNPKATLLLETEGSSFTTMTL